MANPENKEDKIDMVSGNLTLLLKRKLNRFIVKRCWIQEDTELNRISLAIHVQRLTQSFWTSVFLPSMCLILAAEITLFIDEAHFEATIMVNLTSSLVMYTLYNTIQQDLPADSSLKLIDLWLLHGILMPMVVFTILVVDKLSTANATKQRFKQEAPKSQSNNSSAKISGTWCGKEEVQNKRKKVAFIEICQAFVPATSIIFMLTFFGMGISHQIADHDYNEDG